METTNELLPCPFCGSKAEYFVRESSDGSNYWFDVKCTNSMCYLEQGADWYFDCQDEVREIWNNRKPERP